VYELKSGYIVTPIVSIIDKIPYIYFILLNLQ